MKPFIVSSKRLFGDSFSSSSSSTYYFFTLITRVKSALFIAENRTCLVLLSYRSGPDQSCDCGADMHDMMSYAKVLGHHPNA